MNNSQHIKEQLQHYKTKYFKREVVRGALYCTSILLLSFLLFVTLEYLSYFSGTIRAFLFYGFIGISLLALLKYVVIPFIHFQKAQTKISDEDAARDIGTFFPEIRDKLLNIIQLEQLSKSESDLIQASIDTKGKEIGTVAFSDAIDFSVLKKYRIALLIILLVFGLGFLLDKKLITDASNRIIHYDQEYTEPAPFQFILENENLTGVRNENYSFSLKLKGKQIPENVNIIIDDNSFLMKSIGDKAFSFELKHLRSEKKFYFEAAGYHSKSYLLSLIEKSEIQSFEAFINYPSYQRKEDQKITNTSSFSVTEGSTIYWKLKTHGTEQLIFQIGDNIFDTASVVKKDEFEFKHVARESFDYQILLDSKDSIHYNYHIDVIKDAHPTITVEQLVDTVLGEYVFFDGVISDDYGIKVRIGICCFQ